MKNQIIIDAVIKKIDDDLDSIDIDRIITYSGFSYFHFHRLFVSYVGETIAQYIKRLRLERAAYAIRYKGKSMTDAAMDAGYSTPSAFNKAFKDFFGCSPGEHKKTNNRPKEYVMIEPIRVEVIDDIKVYSVRHVGEYNKIGDAYGILFSWAYKNKIKNKKNIMEKNTFSYGIYYDDPNVTCADKLRSDACINNTDDSVELEDSITKNVIKGGKYAVFLHVGEYSKLQDIYNIIFSSYIKRNDIQLADLPIFEKYLNRNPKRTKPENLRTEIYIPIV